MLQHVHSRTVDLRRIDFNDVGGFLLSHQLEGDSSRVQGSQIERSLLLDSGSGLIAG